MTPKENSADKAARLRERRMAELDQTRAAETNAASQSSDIRSVYGIGKSQFLGKMSAPTIFGMGMK